MVRGLHVRNCVRHSTLFVLGIAALPLLAQKPVINPGGVVNAASLASVSGPGHALVPGAIASIFGRNLAASTAIAGSYPLPRTLAGTSVAVNGVAAPLFYVSPGQINFQVPFSTDTGSYSGYGHASIIVTTAAGASDAVTADTWMASPAIFTHRPGRDLQCPARRDARPSRSPGEAGLHCRRAIWSDGTGRRLFDVYRGAPGAFSTAWPMGSRSCWDSCCSWASGRYLE
jgi:hypothetical protein